MSTSRSRDEANDFPVYKSNNAKTNNKTDTTVKNKDTVVQKNMYRNDQSHDN